MYSIKVDKDIIIGIEQMDINLLIPHEKVVLDKKEILKNNLKYKDDDLIISTILICSESNMIIDGHHRYTALKELGYSKIPVTLINYFSNKIITDKEDSFSKKEIILNSKRKNLYDPKSTKHLIYCNNNKEWFPITLISSLYLFKSNKI
ncbi:MAG: ParB N-terminal domain-containing protein [Candidatus Marisimplicoccus sp.]|tara:strand:- start:63 stop:509 length:447 start_codon:yes stop_codon:yes gene_type:complete